MNHSKEIRSMPRAIFATVCLLLVGATSCVEKVRAEPLSGDVFREYSWRPEGKWQRVTWPEVEEPRAREFLPNAVNRIVIDDLHLAERVEIRIEMLLCHAGTVDKKIRVNGGRWIDIPESELIPGTSGQGPPDTEYQSMRYPTVNVSVAELQEGENTFEFTCGPGTALGGWWPQWLLYGVTFGVYYDQSKPHPEGRIVSPTPGSLLDDKPRISALATGPNPIERIDFVGLYDDFNWEGDGNYRQWHGRTMFGQIHNHIGTATGDDREVTWDATWIPTQTKPIMIAARIVDETGMCFVTRTVGDLYLTRPYSVRMYKPYDVPKRWASRAGKRHECKADVDDDLDGAIDAKIVMVTWNGEGAEEIGVGDTKVVTRIGKNHDLSHDEFPVPLDLIRRGTNRLYTFSTTEHHGIEVQWPGMVLLVRFNELEKVTKTPPISSVLDRQIGR